MTIAAKVADLRSVEIPILLIFGIFEVLGGYFFICPKIVQLVPKLNTQFTQLSSRDQAYFLRLCLSIINGWFMTAGAFYLELHPNYCQDGWMYWTEFFIGYLLTDLILSMYTGLIDMASGRNHHLIYLFSFTMIYVSKSACFWYNLNRIRFFATMFTQNMEFRALLGMFGYKDTITYKINSIILTAGFFFVRILVIPFFWYNFLLNRNEVYELTHSLTLYYTTMMLLVLTDIQNLCWFTKLYKSTKINLYKSTEIINSCLKRKIK